MQTYAQNQELPSYAKVWLDGDGNLIDFSTGWTFRLKLVDIVTGATVLNKTNGITGRATSPNLIVAWATGELNVTPAVYRAHITATDPSGNDRVFRPKNPPLIEIEPAA